MYKALRFSAGRVKKELPMPSADFYFHVNLNSDKSGNAVLTFKKLVASVFQATVQICSNGFSSVYQIKYKSICCCGPLNHLFRNAFQRAISLHITCVCLLMQATKFETFWTLNTQSHNGVFWDKRTDPCLDYCTRFSLCHFLATNASFKF